MKGLDPGWMWVAIAVCFFGITAVGVMADAYVKVHGCESSEEKVGE